MKCFFHAFNNTIYWQEKSRKSKIGNNYLQEVRHITFFHQPPDSTTAPEEHKQWVYMYLYLLQI